MKRKAMKKISIIFLLVGVLGLSLFTGCTKKDDKPVTGNQEKAQGTKEAEEDAKEPEVIEIAVFEGGYGKVFYEEAIKSFEKDYPNYTVEMIASPKIEDIIKPRLVAGNPPDMLVEFDLGKLGTLASDGALATLNDVFGENVPGEDIALNEKIINGVLQAACMPLKDNSIYYAPTSTGVSGFYYNKALFRDNSWDVPKTWDEFFMLGDKAKEKGIALYTYQGLYPSYNSMALLPAIRSHAGEKAMDSIFAYEEGAWEDPKVVETLEVFEKIAYGDYLMEGTVAMNHTQAQTEWLNDKALFIPIGVWVETEMKDAIPEGFEFGFTPVPTFTKEEKQFVNSGYGFNVIPAKAKNVEGAKKLLAYFYTDEMVKGYAKHNNAVLAVDNAMDIIGDIIPASVSDAIKTLEFAMPFVEGWYPTPPTQVNMSDEIYNPISSLMNEEIHVDEWVKRIEKATKKLREDIKDVEK